MNIKDMKVGDIVVVDSSYVSSAKFLNAWGVVVMVNMSEYTETMVQICFKGGRQFLSGAPLLNSMETFRGCRGDFPYLRHTTEDEKEIMEPDLENISLKDFLSTACFDGLKDFLKIVGFDFSKKYNIRETLQRARERGVKTYHNPEDWLTRHGYKI